MKLLTLFLLFMGTLKFDAFIIGVRKLDVPKGAVAKNHLSEAQND